MKKFKLSLQTAMLILCVSCSENTIADEVNEMQIKAEVKEMFDGYVDQVNSKGIKDIDYYFSGDKRFQWVEDGILQYPSKTALISSIEEFYPTVSSIRLQIFRFENTILDANTVSLLVEYKEDIALNSGFKFNLDGAMTILTIRENGSWKFLIGHSSIKKPRGG